MTVNITEIPDNWKIIKFSEELYKVYATWKGSYLGEGRWSMNSGIIKVYQDGTHYYFEGYSGSCYKCHKNAYGIASSYGVDLLQRLIELCPLNVEVLEDREDWTKLNDELGYI